MERTRLAAIPLFAELAEADLATIAAAAVEVEAAEGETLATQGDLGHAMFAIESGTVEVSANGRRLATLGAGECSVRWPCWRPGSAWPRSSPPRLYG